MPFINDMIADSEKKKKNIEALQAENSSENDVINSHISDSKGLNSRFRFNIDTIMASVKSEIIGQDQAILAVEDMLKVVRADITDPRKPLYTSLFLGPTGVGKTEIVRALARSLYGDADAFCRIDMNTLSQEHYAASLTGAPPGYVGAKEGKTIIDQEKIEGKLGLPGIVLLDELEKASKEVHQALLNVFDNGLLTVASGEKTYSFRNAIIFMTSNLAAQEIQSLEEKHQHPIYGMITRNISRRKKAVDTIIKKKMLNTFSPEFVNRIDNITTFNWIEASTVEKIVELEIKNLNRRLKKHNCMVEVENDIIKLIANSGFDRQFGARSLRRSMRKILEVPLAEYLLDHHRADETSFNKIIYRAQLSNSEVNFITKQI
ncbi:ATP-dependent protease ATP-binding subunit-like protein AmiB [Vreelandella aquamarina]|jgi:ATP-dependent Clp protease ATP-binding subunit ClpA|uniref:C-terminal, D2-small domain-containing protein, of ClpB protein n=1 Tax=Vreelandella aquamarina TaxID=77097 RepID=A0A1N6DG34_9GAMM|nr:AAA family ATPase [Halomonas meridiana]GED47498.1 ATP-dependent protease ATP-binding subunit-like protein AmiB [Halomonas meridiana]SIN61295.1 C-terminal, D2-small domain-containing protein, of ClpB protein [Halomonas meridiana]SIN69745.1 C-terminal, D2-small domain-containing protein, of ClpB protein [Halomonas meridiana]SIO27346.1 C-terminal, D2-small domain-containing protein, of ClpB protein [Halomonas meridiana]